MRKLKKQTNPSLPNFPKSPSKFIDKETISQSGKVSLIGIEVFKQFYAKNVPKTWNSFSEQIQYQFKTTALSIEDSPKLLPAFPVNENEGIILVSFRCELLYRPISDNSIANVPNIPLAYYENVKSSALLSGTGVAFDPTFTILRSSQLGFSYDLTIDTESLFENKIVADPVSTPYFGGIYAPFIRFNQLNTNVLAMPEFNNAVYLFEQGQVNIPIKVIDSEATTAFGGIRAFAYNYLPPGLIIDDGTGLRGFLTAPYMLFEIRGYKLNRTDMNELRRFVELSKG